MSTPLADDFTAIKAALERLEADKKPAEAPKAWPSYSAGDSDLRDVDVVYPMIFGVGPVDVSYTADDWDPA